MRSTKVVKSRQRTLSFFHTLSRVISSNHTSVKITTRENNIDIAAHSNSEALEVLNKAIVMFVDFEIENTRDMSKARRRDAEFIDFKFSLDAVYNIVTVTF